MNQATTILTRAGIIALMSFFIAPLFREKLNTQFMPGARN